jgi:hypothetical protein
MAQAKRQGMGGNPMRPTVSGRVVLALCAVLAMAIGVATATAGSGNGNGGNSANAKLCQKNGWHNLFRTDGTGFASQDECVSYGAQGGTILTSPPASQSQLDCEANAGQFSTTNDPFGGPGIFLWSCSGYSQATAGNTIAEDCFDDGGIPNTFFDSNGVLRGTSCYK